MFGRWRWSPKSPKVWRPEPISLSESRIKLVNKLGGGSRAWQLANSAARSEQFPSSGFASLGLRPEVAFVGRSNVGKSSLINVLLSQRIARASRTPGRTQMLNFFHQDNNQYVVDLPGYGFAKAPKKLVEDWNRLIGDYVREREALRRMFVLIDSRRSLMESDAEFLDFLEEYSVPYQLVLTKGDKLSPNGIADCVGDVASFLARKTRHCADDILVCSASKRKGLDEIKDVVAEIIYSPPRKASTRK